MSDRRYAKTTDLNQNEIVKELRRIPGVSVFVAHQPLDLICGRNGVNYLIEIKNPKGRGRRYTPKQQEFKRDWKGQQGTAECLDDALRILGLLPDS